LPVIILDVDDLVRSIDNIISSSNLSRIKQSVTKELITRKKILVVDDSLTVREVERRLLENAGYDVTAAVDGMEGWNLVQKNNFDLIISDIDMPRMNGIQFVSTVKGDTKYKHIPIIIISYKDRAEDKMKGLNAGANHYLTKSSFHDKNFIITVKDLIGEV
jgi:two-component system sensor histidine kinase and response regulator WspE